VHDEPVALRDHAAAWHEQFTVQRERLMRLLQPWLAAAPEHVGSTAVPGLRAKPIVDILAPVRSLDAARAAVPMLEADGWLFWPNDPNQHYRLWFLRPTPAARTHHLQLMQHDHAEPRNLLLFRDALRGDTGLRQAYAALKDELARIHGSNRNAYSDAKSNFVRTVLRQAGAAPSARRPIA
jgi:GrpB-like predicted nucleotidyltransferase (UPF0157 family)